MQTNIQITKPWGYYITHFMSEKCVMKTIFVNPGQSISLQKHQFREEYWYIQYGEGLFQSGYSSYKAVAGDKFTIPPNTLHRVTNTGPTIMVIQEMQYGEMCDESDIIRVEDDYGRAKG